MSIPPSSPDSFPILTSSLLLTSLKPLYPIPRKNQPLASRPTQSTLASFLLKVPQAQQALAPLSDDDGFSTKEWIQKKFARDLGLVALWCAELLDEKVREESKDLKEGAAPVLPVSAPPLILTLLSHTITHVLQPLFLQSFPPPPKSSPPPTSSSSTASSSSRFTEILPEVSPTSSELAARTEAKNTLEITLARVLNLAVVRPVTEVGKLVRDGGVVRSVIKMAVALGWEDATEGEEKREEFKTLVLRVLDSFRPTTTLGLLSPLLSSTVFPSLVSKAAGGLMTRALLRPGGVEGVLQGVFGGSEGAAETGREESDVGKKSISVAKVLGTVPGGMDPEEYLTSLIPRLIPLLTSPTTPSTYLRPLSLSLTTLLSHPSPLISLPTQRILLPYIHSPLLSPHAHQPSKASSFTTSAAFNALSLLLPLILLTPPSSTSHTILLGPILPQLFGLHWHLQQSRTADMVLGREVEGCLRSWGRVGTEREVRIGLDGVVRGGRGWEGGKGGVLPGEEAEEGEDEEKEWYWEGGGEDLKVVWGSPPPITSPASPPINDPSSSSTQPPTKIEQQTLSLLSLHPPPNLFLAYLKSLDRPSLAGDLFVSLLNQLDSPSDSTSSLDDEPHPEDPRHRVLLMQIVLSMVDSVGESLVKGEEGRVLAFVAHVLASSAPKIKPTSSAKKGKGREELLLGEGGGGGLKSLRIVDSDDDEEEEVGGQESDGLDSDDEVELPVDEDAEAVEGMFGGSGKEGEEGGEGEVEEGGGRLGLVGTAIGLLVAVLQANESLSPLSSPILTLIQSSLQHHLNSSTPSIRHLTREARLLISVREATSFSTNSLPTNPTDPKTEATNKILDSYRQALKLVQDPLVPVRAHGLITLRQLVLPPAQQRRERPGSNTAPTTSTPSTTASAIPQAERSLLPPALVPAILDVFLQSVQDPDSYVYLNAVKGLSALVDGWGKDVLGRIMGVYAKGVGQGGWEGAGGEMERAELDARLRVGEALCGVVERSEGGLGAHASTLIPPLLLTFRASNLPTALRSSALTILTIISSTSPLTIAPYASDLVLACVDLLQVESVPMAPHPATTTTVISDDPLEGSRPTDKDEGVVPEEDEPTLSPLLSNPKHPILRRAALHFTSSVLRADSEKMGTLDREVWRRASVVVGYVGATDSDLMVRGLAGDVKADLKRSGM